MKKEVTLHILGDENEKPRCQGRVPYDEDANLEGFRAFLEANAIVPWPFDFWDSQLNTRIATKLEALNTLELHGHAITVIRSRDGQSMAGKESMAILKPTTVACSTISANEQSVSMPCRPFVCVSCQWKRILTRLYAIILLLAIITRRTSSNNSVLHSFCVLTF